jgi:glucose-6-phosphate 1-epimerase
MSQQDSDSSRQGLVEMIQAPGGLDALLIRFGDSEAEVVRHGAHVSRFAPSGRREVLWLSGSSQWRSDAPIRGGVPICFPWFGPREGDEDAPSHGFARISRWQVEAVEHEQRRVSVALSLEESPETRELWDHSFHARMQVVLADHIEMHLSIENTGSAPMTFSQALHTYLAVSDVRKIRILGLGGREYLDKLQDSRRMRQEEEAIRFEEETDRIYVNTEDDCVLEDPGWNRRIRIAKEGSRSTVIWNPWVDKSARMEDFGDDEWPGMVCIESANAADNAVTLEPGNEHTLSVGISVEDL